MERLRREISLFFREGHSAKELLDLIDASVPLSLSDMNAMKDQLFELSKARFIKAVLPKFISEITLSGSHFYPSLKNYVPLGGFHLGSNQFPDQEWLDKSEFVTVYEQDRLNTHQVNIEQLDPLGYLRNILDKSKFKLYVARYRSETGEEQELRLLNRVNQETRGGISRG